MLSKTSIVILGMLHDQKLSAYDMLKKIDEMNMKYWLPIGNTTLYETALRLEKKDYIQGDDVVSTKRTYQITEKGIKELKDTVTQLFLQIDYDTIWFSLATLYSYVLEHEVLAELIEKRKVLLKEYYDGTLENLNHLKEYHVPYHGVCTIERMVQVIELEQKSLHEFEIHFTKR